MIPFSVLSGNFIVDSDGAVGDEFRILDLSVDSFTFRLASPLKKKPAGFLLHFYSFSSSGFKDLLLTEYELEEEGFSEEEEAFSEEQETGPVNENSSGFSSYTDGAAFSRFFHLYRVYTDESTFFTLSRALQDEYQNYVHLKTTASPGQLSASLTGYPVGQEEDFAGSWSVQKKEMLATIHPDSVWEQANPLSAGLMLDCPSLWAAYLSVPFQKFFSDYCRENHLDHHPLRHWLPEYLYIGNQFCPALFPEEEMLRQLMIKCRKEHLRPVLVLAPQSEHLSPKTWECLSSLLEWWMGKEKAFECPGPNVDLPEPMAPEIVVNDWGSLLFFTELSERIPLICTLGTLLQKRRKDPRLSYWKSWQNSDGGQGKEHPLIEHSWNAAFYQKHLLDTCRVGGALYETCGYSFRIAEFPVSFKKTLLFPFYQTNTASLCTLQAYCETGERGKQLPPDNCPRYCQDHVFLYPRHLNMVGRYNSLFGLDRAFLSEGDILQDFVRQGVERLVFAFI